jgi:hypothetical protein
MKKALLAAILVVLFTGNQLIAQEKDSITTLPTITVTSTTVVNNEVDKAFKKAFPTAQDLKWYEMGKFYIAKFIENDMKHNALFTKKGYLKYDISYGYEKDLPDDIRTRIREAFEEYKISHVAHVKEADRNVWVATMESLNHIILVRVEGDEMELVEKYEKSK